MRLSKTVAVLSSNHRRTGILRLVSNDAVLLMFFFSTHLHKYPQLEIPIVTFLRSFASYFLRGYHVPDTVLNTEMNKKENLCYCGPTQTKTCKPINKYFQIVSVL